MPSIHRARAALVVIAVVVLLLAANGIMRADILGDAQGAFSKWFWTGRSSGPADGDRSEGNPLGGGTGLGGGSDNQMDPCGPGRFLTEHQKITKCRNADMRPITRIGDEFCYSCPNGADGNSTGGQSGSNERDGGLQGGDGIGGGGIGGGGSGLGGGDGIGGGNDDDNHGSGTDGNNTDGGTNETQNSCERTVAGSFTSDLKAIGKDNASLNVQFSAAASANGFVYVGTTAFFDASAAGVIYKLDANTMREAKRLALQAGDLVSSLLVDRSTNTGYAGILNLSTKTFRVMRIDLSSMSVTGELARRQTVEIFNGTNFADPARFAFMDEEKRRAYFAVNTAWTGFMAIDLDTFTMTTPTLQGGSAPLIGVIDPAKGYLYMASDGGIQKMSLSVGSYVASLSFNERLAMYGAVGDTSKGYAYFLTSSGLFRLRLSDFTIDGSLNLDGTARAKSMVRVDDMLYLFSGGSYGYSDVLQIYAVRLSDFSWIDHYTVPVDPGVRAGAPVVTTDPDGRFAYVGDAMVRDADPTIRKITLNGSSCVADEGALQCKWHCDSPITATKRVISCGAGMAFDISRNGTIVFTARYDHGFMEGVGGLFVRTPDGTLEHIDSPAPAGKTKISGDGNIITWTTVQRSGSDYGGMFTYDRTTKVRTEIPVPQYTVPSLESGVFFPNGSPSNSIYRDLDLFKCTAAKIAVNMDADGNGDGTAYAACYAEGSLAEEDTNGLGDIYIEIIDPTQKRGPWQLVTKGPDGIGTCD